MGAPEEGGCGAPATALGGTSWRRWCLSKWAAQGERWAGSTGRKGRGMVARRLGWLGGEEKVGNGAAGRRKGEPAAEGWRKGEGGRVVVVGGRVVASWG